MICKITYGVEGYLIGLVRVLSVCKVTYKY